MDGSMGKGKGTSRSEVHPPPGLAQASASQAHRRPQPSAGIDDPHELNRDGIPGNPVVINKATESDLIEVLRFQEKKLGLHDPTVVQLKSRIAALQRKRQDNMTVEQQVQSSADRMKNKQRAKSDAEAKVKRAELVVEEAQVELACAREALESINAELNQAIAEHTAIVAKVQPKAPTKLGGNNGTPMAGFVVPDDAPQDAKDIAAQIQQATMRLQQMILESSKRVQEDKAKADQPASQAAARSTPAPNLGNDTISLADLPDHEMLDKQGAKERRTTSITVEDETPASKRPKASVSRSSHGEAPAGTQCS